MSFEDPGLKSLEWISLAQDVKCYEHNNKPLGYIIYGDSEQQNDC
jgi:hypothetical protein